MVPFFQRNVPQYVSRLFNRWKIVQGLDIQFYHEIGELCIKM